jgi:hypothetical protein
MIEMVHDFLQPDFDVVGFILDIILDFCGLCAGAVPVWRAEKKPYQTADLPGSRGTLQRETVIAKS